MLSLTEYPQGDQSSKNPKFAKLHKCIKWANTTRLRLISYIYNNNESQGKRSNVGRRGEEHTEAEPAEGQEKRSSSRPRAPLRGEPIIKRETEGIIGGKPTPQDPGRCRREIKRRAIQHGRRVSLPPTTPSTLPIRRTQDVSRPTRRPQQLHPPKRSTTSSI